MDKKQINQESINDENKIQIPKTKNSDLYKTILLEEYIYLKPSDLNKKIEDVILDKLKQKVEGKCTNVGYVIHDSINIQTRSLGMINNASFDGITTYKIKFTADVCNPVIGQIIQCQVGNIDKSQVICYINEIPDKSPLEIYLFKYHHVGNSEYSELKKGDLINVKIGGSKWEYKDTQIISIAQYIGKAIN